MDLHTVSPLEQVLAHFWDDTLGTTVSDRLTDFFEAGADDVAAERLLSRVEETFHLEIPLAALREASTVAAFAGVLKHQVDHPGRLERLAERLLHDAQHAPAAERAAERGGHSGASW